MTTVAEALAAVHQGPVADVTGVLAEVDRYPGVDAGCAVLRDATGEIPLVLYATTFALVGQHVTDGAAVRVGGFVEGFSDGPTLVVGTLHPAGEAR